MQSGAMFLLTHVHVHSADQGRKPWLTRKHQPAFQYDPVVVLSLELVAALFTHGTHEVVDGLCPPYRQMTQ